ncbi:hypothetical protein [Enterobacter kobei]|uniref:hypothetical protein n=1 Tax=Enterobacter kobei TaxID=208224 RepID=UPI0020266130|nr:hypothetical protein [Enterobacter kobei]URL26611.1 hypothetical protein JZY03_16895 [Enterobacter kobei]
MIKLQLTSLLIYSAMQDKHFYTEFGSGLNIIHGKNTSGKSTLIQSIIYAMGINYGRDYLKEINDSSTIFLLEGLTIDDDISTSISFARNGDTIAVKFGENKTERFHGINGNSSYEYGRYKKFFNKIFRFDLLLQNKTELVSAPLEAAFLPFYISQDVGWVYIRESIGDYRFYKDFKNDYLDYYCGIEKGTVRLNKYKLQSEKQQIDSELKQIERYKNNRPEIKLSIEVNKRFMAEALEFLEMYKNTNALLSEKEDEYNRLCSKQLLLENRQKVLFQTRKNLKKQRPSIDNCPTCNQILPGSIRHFYNYAQDVNDIEKENSAVKEAIKKTQSLMNSSISNIALLRDKIKIYNSYLEKFKIEGMTFDSWLNIHSIQRLAERLSSEKQTLEIKSQNLMKELSDLGDEDHIEIERRKIEKVFHHIFSQKVSALQIKLPKEDKYSDLYSINSFPYTGVELHKIIMSYNISFYKLVVQLGQTHVFPFMIDAIFKEDIDEESRLTILQFLSNEMRYCNQSFISIAEYNDDDSKLDNELYNIKKINKTFFNDKAKCICIGESKKERSLLSNVPFTKESVLDYASSLLMGIDQ